MKKRRKMGVPRYLYIDADDNAVWGIKEGNKTVKLVDLKKDNILFGELARVDTRMLKNVKAVKYKGESNKAVYITDDVQSIEKANLKFYYKPRRLNKIYKLSEDAYLREYRINRIDEYIEKRKNNEKGLYALKLYMNYLRIKLAYKIVDGHVTFEE